MRCGTKNLGVRGEVNMENALEIYKDKSGRYWIEGMCNTIRDRCGEQCDEGCSVFDTMQKIGREMAEQEARHEN